MTIQRLEATFIGKGLTISLMAPTKRADSL